MKILTINNKKDEKFLRRRVADFDFSKFTKKEINNLIKEMREAMFAAAGVGLAANQVGLDLRVFIAQLPKQKKKLDRKFYAIFNPEIIKFSKEKTILEERCLSIPGYYGDVERSNKITLVGQDKYGKKIKIKALGLLARVFQHEVDHLNGILFIDKAKNLKKIEQETKA